MATEAGHHPNRVYVDQAGNLHLNGASIFDAAETDVTGALNSSLDGLTATATELNKLHSVTGGTVTASKALVVDATSNLDALAVTTLSLGAAGGTALSSTATEINQLHSQGAVAADFAKLHALTATAAELNVLHSVTAGTTAASSALVVDAGKTLDVLTVTTLTTTTLTVTTENVTVLNGGVGGSTAAAGTTNADAATLPAGTALVYPTTGADGTKGVIVSTSDKVTGRMLLVGNGVSNQILKVYAPAGGTINGGSANAAFASASGKGVVLVCLSGAGNTWLAW